MLVRFHQEIVGCVSTYSKLITPSDEGFAFNVLEFYLVIPMGRGHGKAKGCDKKDKLVGEKFVKAVTLFDKFAKELREMKKGRMTT